MSIEPRYGKYRVRIMVKGKSYVIGTYADEGEALARDLDARRAKAKGAEFFIEWFETFCAEPQEVPTFREYGEQHVEHAQSNTRKLDQVLPKLYDVFGDVPLDKLTRSHVLALKKKMKGKASTTINNYLSAGSVVFKAAQDEPELCDVLTANPFAGCRVKVAATPTEKITDDHHATLLDRARSSEIEAMPIILGVLNETGMRVNNVLQLRRDHVDIRERLITIPGDEVKNGCTLIIPISEQLAMMLDHQIAASPSRYIFTAQKDADSALSYMTFLKAWKRLHSAEPELPLMKIHGYRVAAATRAAEAGCSVAELMALFGWKTPAQAIRYVRRGEKLARAAVAKVQAAKSTLDAAGKKRENRGADRVM